MSGWFVTGPAGPVGPYDLAAITGEVSAWRGLVRRAAGGGAIRPRAPPQHARC